MSPKVETVILAIVCITALTVVYNNLSPTPSSHEEKICGLKMIQKIDFILHSCVKLVRDHVRPHEPLRSKLHGPPSIIRRCCDTGCTTNEMVEALCYDSASPTICPAKFPDFIALCPLDGDHCAFE